jgi:two-component system sensor histidine kinase BarA
MDKEFWSYYSGYCNRMVRAPNNTTQPTMGLSGGQTQGSSSHRILLAEDNHSCQKLAICILTTAGYEVNLAENGQQAVVMVQERSYDLILMDMQMPIMNGLIATMTLRNLGYRNIPIIGLTANAYKKDRDRCLDAGMNDYISKPVTPTQLIEKIVPWLSRGMIIPSPSTNKTCKIDTTKHCNGVTEGSHSEETPQGTHPWKRQVLVADDSSVNQMLIRALLNKLGLEVAVVDNGQQAVQAVEKKSYDLIFMDMQMPVMDGCEAVRILRSRSVHTPIIALTANAMPEDRKKCIEAGCSDYLSKPISRPQLLEIVEKYLKPISCGNILPE